MIDRHHGWNKSFKPLFIGFVLSLIVMAGAYRTAVKLHVSKEIIDLALFGLGTVQALIQLVFFLQIGLESRPRWNLITFLFLILVLIVIIGGSIWIMHNLNYNVMPKGTV